MAKTHGMWDKHSRIPEFDMALAVDVKILVCEIIANSLDEINSYCE